MNSKPLTASVVKKWVACTGEVKLVEGVLVCEGDKRIRFFVRENEQFYTTFKVFDTEIKACSYARAILIKNMNDYSDALSEAQFKLDIVNNRLKELLGEDVE